MTVCGMQANGANGGGSFVRAAEAASAVGEREAVRSDLARFRLIARVALAEREYAEGRYADGPAFVESVRRECGL